MLDKGALEAFRRFFAETDASAWIACTDGESMAFNAAFAWRHGLDQPPLAVHDAGTLVTGAEQATLARIGRDLTTGEADGTSAVLTFGTCLSNYTIRLVQHGDDCPVLLGQEQKRSAAPVPRDAPTNAGDNRRAHARLRQLVDNAPGALFEFRQGRDGACSLPYFSAKLPLILGVDASALRRDGSAVLDTLLPEDAKDFAATLAESMRDLLDVNRQLRILHPQHGERWLMCSAIPAPEADGSVTWFGNLIDVTERVKTRLAAQEATAALAAAHRRLTTIADNAPAGIFELYRDPQGNGSLRYCSARMMALLGFEDSAPQGFFLRLRAHMRPRDFAELHASMERSRVDETQWSHRFCYKHPNRGILWLSGSATPHREADGSAVWVGTIHDVTPDAEREEDLRRANRLAEAMRARSEWQAFHDPLTGLANRRFFDRMLGQRVDEARRADTPRPCTLIRIDGDRFKHVNDTLGHETGDAVLRRIGQVLLREIGPDDLAARIGGDEFTVLLAPGATEATASAVCARVRIALAEPFTHNGRRCQIEASHGIAHLDDLAAEGGDILCYADAALFRAKALGRNRTELFTPALREAIVQDRQIASELQNALARDEFIPVFQPQICARTGKVHGVETLLRWQHPDRGLLTPDRFLKVAEQLRIVPDLDAAMIGKSRAVLRDWRDAGVQVPKISFNVSSGRMRDPSILHAADGILGDGTRVAFELLETILMEEEDDVFRFNLDSLRESGVEIEIDDFGSGHASIIALLAISPDALKIDRRLVMPLDDRTRNRRLIRAIVEIAESFGIRTVAEGVENAAQAALLNDLGCDVLQGYYFARPLTADGIVDYLRRQMPDRSASA
ncbi:putative bifunctional diguanylate cyclase/phosphodiesterase [Tropicibacter sp. S64]|uniref:putative bifunctional diguanylate cyclase/phosphodiesterase n=1 Tax=Tropicibacter sp. S64 TaxID=3415122 RepID=UPI003C7E0929